jgi:uncharacterized protein
MLIKRSIENMLRERLSESKILVLRGPRGAGKRTLLSHVLPEGERMVLDCTDKKVRRSIDSAAQFSESAAAHRFVVLYEAQLLGNLQEIIDHALSMDPIENLVLCCSFEPQLQEELWEALREQGLEMELMPLSYGEMAQHGGLASEEKELEKRLVYGYYPQIAAEPDNAEKALYDLLEKSIFTQLAATERINKQEQLIHLLRLLAFNIGEAVSFNELARECGLDNETAERYVRLLEKADLLFLLPSFSNEHRYELKKSNVVYFTDNGIRNALIRAFQPMAFRNDVPQLWKNWVISERRKANRSAGRQPQAWFWKTHTKQEMDYIESSGGSVAAFKMQWDKKKKAKVPASFSALYPDFKTGVVNRSTFWSLITKK